MKAQYSETVTGIQKCVHWRNPSDFPVLNIDDVHVWRIPLNQSQDIVADQSPILSTDENERAVQMLWEEATRQFVLSHGVLRRILTRYLDERPERIRFIADARGKPHLASDVGAQTICFSLSHSDAFALCAVTKNRDVGVDIERIRPISGWREIAARYFSKREYATLCALPKDSALEAFFHVWTRKEAYTKALGLGVSQLWTQFSVSLAPGVVEQLPSAEIHAEQESQFAIWSLEPGSDYVAAVSTQGMGWHLSCWHWSWDD